MYVLELNTYIFYKQNTSIKSIKLWLFVHTCKHIKVNIFNYLPLDRSLINHCKCDAGCDFPDVQFRFNVSPI